MDLNENNDMFRKLPPVPGVNSNYNTIDRIKKGKGIKELKKIKKCLEA